jgi:hypothetical protein
MGWGSNVAPVILIYRISISSINVFYNDSGSNFNGSRLEAVGFVKSPSAVEIGKIG